MSAGKAKTLDERWVELQAARKALTRESAEFTERLVKNPNAKDDKLIAAGRRYRNAANAYRARLKKDSA